MAKRTNRKDQLPGTLAILGVGKMGEAFLWGIHEAKLLSPKKIIACDINENKLDEVREKLGVQCTTDAVEAVKQASVVLLAVKPKVAPELLRSLQSAFHEDQLLISIVAGLDIRSIEQYGPMAIVRAMPNIGAMFGMSATALTWSDRVTEQQRKVALNIFKAVGTVVEVHEEEMDAVTGLSGSGPAYILLVIEALIDAGVKLGLQRAVARDLVLQTIFGSAVLLMMNGDMHPAKIRDDITTPGGTTIHGLYELETAGVRAAFMRAVEAAAVRSEELRKKY